MLEEALVCDGRASTELSLFLSQDQEFLMPQGLCTP